MYAPTISVSSSSGLHFKNRAALGTCAVARGKGIQINSLLIQEDRTHHVREAPKRKSGREERKGHVKHVTRRRDSRCIVRQRHQKQEPVYHKHFIAVNKRILSCSSITDLARLVSQEKRLNEVNVCSATTQLHRLLRQLPDTKGTPRYSSSTDQRASSSSAAAAGAAAEAAAASQTLPTLVNATLSVDGLSPDHCVRILTAHAWIKHMLPPQAWQLQQQSGLRLDSSSSSSREAWHSMLQRLCSALAAASTTTPPEHLSRGLWACARLGHVHSGLVAAASARMLQIVQEHHGGMPQEQQQQQQQQYPTRDGADPLHQGLQARMGSVSGRDDGCNTEGKSTVHALPASAEIPLRSTLSLPSHAHDQQDLPASQHVRTKPSPLSLADTLSNLVWALGQLLQPPSTPQPNLPPPQHHASHSNMSNTAAAMVTMNRGNHHEAVHEAVHGTACTPEVVQLVAAMQQRVTEQPEWLARWGPQRMATLMHGLANLQLTRLRVLNTSGVLGPSLQASSLEHYMHLAGPTDEMPHPGHPFSSTSTSQPPTHNSTTPSVPSQLQLNPRKALCSTSASLAAPHQAPMHNSTPSALPPTPPSLILALCQSVHCLLADHSSPSQRSAQQAEMHMPQPAASSEQNAKGASLCPAAGVPTAAHLPPQALSNMAWSLATLWSLADQQPVLEKRFSPRDSQVDAHLGGRDGRPEAGSSSMASSTYSSSTTVNQSASSNSILPGAPSEREPQAHELHAACAHAVRALAHAALGQQGHGLLRFSPHELCSLVQAVADLHAALPPDLMNQSVSAGTPAAGTGHSGTSKSAARGKEAMSSSSNSPSSSTAARALNSQRLSMFTASSPSGISPPHGPHLPPRPTPAGGKPATTHRPAPLPAHAYTHNQQHSPAVALFLQNVFAAALDSVAARVAAFPVVDCCEVLHACAMVGLPPTPPAAVSTAAHERAPQQQAQKLRYHLQALCARIEAQPQELPSSRVPMLLWSMARLGLVPARLLAYLLDPSEASTLRSATTAARTGLATIGDSFSQADGIPAAASSTSGKAGRSSTSQGTENVAHRGGAERMAAMAGGKTQGEWALAGLSPDRLAKVAWALATMAQCSHADAQQQQLDHPNVEQQQQQGSSTSGKAQQELQQQSQPDFQLQRQQQLQQQDRDPRALAISLLLRLEPDAVQLAEAMDNRSLCMVLWAFASNRCHCPRLLAAAAPELLRRCMVTGTAAPPAASAPVSQPAAHSSRDVHQPLLAASTSAAAPPAAFPSVSQPSAHSTAAAAAAAATPAATSMTGAAFAPPAAASAPVPQPAVRSTAPAATPAATLVPGAAFAPSATSTPDPQPAAHTSRSSNPPPPSHSLHTARSGLHQPTLVPPLVQGAAPTASLTVPASSSPSVAAGAAAAAAVLHPSPSAPGTAAAAAPQASSASKRAAGAAAAVLHTSPSAPGTSPSAPNSSPLPAQALPCADALDFFPASQAAVGMDSHSSSSNSSTTTTTTTTNTSSRTVRLGSTKLRRGIRLRRPGSAHQAGLRLKLHSHLGTASTRTLHASPPPTGSDTSSSTSSTSSNGDVTNSSIKSNTNSSSSSSSSIDTRSGAVGGKGEHEAAMFTPGFDGLGSSSSSTDGNTPSSGTSTAPLSSSSIHASSTSGRTSSVGGQRATAPQALSCQQLAMALWAVAHLLEAGHNQLGTSMAPLRLFRAAAPAVAHAAAMSQTDAKNLAMVTWAYASVKVNPGERVVSVLAHSCLRAAPHMSMQGQAMVAHALAQLSFSSPPLYAGLAAAMLSKAQRLPVLQPRLHQPLSRSRVQQLQQQLQEQQQQQQQQQQQHLSGAAATTPHGYHDFSTAVAALSTMALVLACKGVPYPQIMDVAVAATLSAAARGCTSSMQDDSSPDRLAMQSLKMPGLSDASTVRAGAAAAAAAITPSVLSPAIPSVPRAASIPGRTPHAASKSMPSRASSWRADASDAAPTHTSAAQSLQQGTKVRRLGGVSAVELVQLLFALGRAKHPCAPRKLDVLVGMLARELGLPGLPIQRMQQLSGQASGSHVGVQQDILEAEMRRQLLSEQQEEHQLLQQQRQEEAHHLLHQQEAQHSLQQQQHQGQQHAGTVLHPPQSHFSQPQLASQSASVHKERQGEQQLLQQQQQEAQYLQQQQEEQQPLQQQQEQAPGLSHHSPGLLAMFLMACVSLRYQPPQQLLTAVCCTLEGNVSRLSTQTVCELLCSLAALQHEPGAVLLDELVGVVEGRVMQQRQELLTLESLVKLAWGLACLKQYKRPLFKRAVRRALGSSAGALNERPQLLRQLLELKMLFQVERRAGGYWHVLQPSWERRVAAGGADRVPEAVLLQSAGLPPPELASAVKAVEVVKAQVLVMLHALGVDDPKWHSLRQGDQACIFHYAPSRRRGRSNSLEQQLQQRGQISCGRDETGSTDSSTAAGRGSSMEWAAISDLGGGLHGRDGRQERAVGHPGSSIAGAGKEWGCSSVAFEGRRPTRSRKLAVTLLAPWHLSVNAGGVPLASAAIRDRILARKQCSVLAVRVEEWLALSTEARRQLLRGFLFR